MKEQIWVKKSALVGRCASKQTDWFPGCRLDLWDTCARASWACCRGYICSNRAVGLEEHGGSFEFGCVRLPLEVKGNRLRWGSWMNEQALHNLFPLFECKKSLYWILYRTKLIKISSILTQGKYTKISLEKKFTLLFSMFWLRFKIRFRFYSELKNNDAIVESKKRSVQKIFFWYSMWFRCSIAINIEKYLFRKF